MHTAPVTRAVKASDVPLDRLAANPNVPKGEKLEAACRAFESVLLRQILENATKPVVQSTVNPESSVGAVYRDLVNEQMAESISRSGQFGLARTLVDQLKDRSAPAAADAAAQAAKNARADAADPASGLRLLVEPRPQAQRLRRESDAPARRAAPSDPAAGLAPLFRPEPLRTDPQAPKARLHE